MDRSVVLHSSIWNTNILFRSTFRTTFSFVNFPLLHFGPGSTSTWRGPKDKGLQPVSRAGRGFCAVQPAPKPQGPKDTDRWTGARLHCCFLSCFFSFSYPFKTRIECNMRYHNAIDKLLHNFSNKNLKQLTATYDTTYITYLYGEGHTPA